MLKSARKLKFSPGKQKLLQKNKNVFKKMRMNVKQPNEKGYFYKKPEEKVKLLKKFFFFG